jgi:hypothetical protein
MAAPLFSAGGLAGSKMACWRRPTFHQWLKCPAQPSHQQTNGGRLQEGARLGGEVKTGFHIKSLAFGADYMLNFEGVTREDLDG